MILILTPDDLAFPDNTNYDHLSLDDFDLKIGWIFDGDGEDIDNHMLLTTMCDTIIFQYPNEHRGMETIVLYKKEE